MDREATDPGSGTAKDKFTNNVLCVYACVIHDAPPQGVIVPHPMVSVCAPFQGVIVYHSKVSLCTILRCHCTVQRCSMFLLFGFFFPNIACGDNE